MFDDRSMTMADRRHPAHFQVDIEGGLTIRALSISSDHEEYLANAATLIVDLQGVIAGHWGRNLKISADKIIAISPVPAEGADT